MMTAMKKIFEDKNNQEKVVAESGLEYCIVRPGGLNVEKPTGVVNVIDGEAGSIPRADVARFCLDAVTVEDFPYIGKAPCISSTGGELIRDLGKTRFNPFLFLSHTYTLIISCPNEICPLIYLTFISFI